MKILFLSPHNHIIQFLKSFGDGVIQSMDPLDGVVPEGVEFIISYGYRYKIAREITEQFKGRAINLHISYLPWNRGADPNLWSFLEDTPKGVTIHYLDGNIDTGPVIAQRNIDYSPEDTLATTYRRLMDTIEELFREKWPVIREGNTPSVPQLTFHRVRDKDAYQHLLPQGWDTPVKDILGKAK